jgi:riboflavin biosynthesis pyrimidine reductase
VRQIFPAPGHGELGLADPIGAAGPILPGAGNFGDLIAALGEIYAYPDEPVTPVRDGQPIAGRPTAGRQIAGRPVAGQWIKANMIASADGAVAVNGRSGVLSGPADRLVFAVLRSLADVVMVGAETARAERYRQAQPDELWRQLRVGRPPAPPIVVVTKRLDLDLSGRLFGQGPGLARTVVLTTELAGQGRLKEASRVADVVVAGTEAVTAQAMIDALAARGHRRILVEGGPMLLGQLVAERLLDELCLTISPVLEGGYAAGRLTSGLPALGHIPTQLTEMQLATVLEDDGFLLNRYVRA